MRIGRTLAILAVVALCATSAMALSGSGGFPSAGQFTQLCSGTAPCTNTGVAGDIAVGDVLYLNDPANGATNNLKSFALIDGSHNLDLGNGVTGKGQWGPGTDFQSSNGSGADWVLTRSVLGGGNPGLSFGTVNVAPDTGLERTGVAAAKLTGSMLATKGVGGTPVALASSACTVEGLLARQTNSTAACSSGAIATFAGTTHCFIGCNGTNWIQFGF